MESSEDKLSSLPERVYAQGKNVKRLSIGRDNQPVSYIQANGKAQKSPDRPLSADPVRALPTSGSGVHRRSLTTNNTTGSGSGLGSGSGHLAHAHANSHTNQYLDSPRYETDLASPNSPNNYARRVQDWRAVGSPRRASYAPGSASFSAQSPLFGPSPIETFSLRNGFGSNGQGITNPPPGFGSPLDKPPQHQPLQQQQQQPLPIFQYYRGREHGTRSFSLSLKPQDGDDQDDYFLSSPLRQAVHNHNSGSQQNRNGSISSNRHAQNNYDFDQDGEVDEEDALESKSWARRMTSYSPSPYNTSGVNSSNNSRRLQQQQQQHQHHHNQNNLDHQQQQDQQQQWNFRRQSYSIGAPTALPPLPKPVQSTSTSNADYSLVDSKMKDLSLNFQLDRVPSGFMENYGNLFDNTTLGKDNPKLRMYVSNNPVDTTSGSKEVSYIVEFKRGRTDVFHCNNTAGEGTKYKEGDLVIVEADRGEDLGKITAIIDTFTSATNKKLLLRPASRSECNMLLDKHRDELKALSICQTKIRQKRLDEIMEVLDAEYQWDRKRLTFFYLSEDRIDFRDLVKDLFKIYKTRIWMCSVDRQSQGQQQGQQQGQGQ